MDSESLNYAHLINELKATRKRVMELEAKETERKRVEEALRLHSEILLNLAEGVYLIRVSDGMIAFANPTFESMFGYTPGELVGKHASKPRT